VKQPKLTPKDRGLLVLLASRVRDWKNALLICEADPAHRVSTSKFRSRLASSYHWYTSDEKSRGSHSEGLAS
jgi:hypothetical protein